jgi:hypothetical protein
MRLSPENIWQKQQYANKQTNLPLNYIISSKIRHGKIKLPFFHNK